MLSSGRVNNQQMEQYNPNNQFWLQTTFQNTIEVALQLSNNPAPEETPYVYKYEAIAKLKTLVSRPHAFHFIVQVVLGEVYSDVDQLSDSLRSYELALLSLSELPQNQVGKFYNYLAVVYNMLGLSYINREQSNEGVGCLAKAMDIYKLASATPSEDVYHNRSDTPRGRKFRYYYQGGLNREQLENSNTLSLFYLAQCYTKLGFKDKAAQNCGFTLQRQYATKKYQINDFCHNLIGLAEYYEGNHFYAQALYLLMLAIEVLPKEADRKRKMRAKVQTALGQLQSKMLEYSVENVKKAKSKEEIENQNIKANKKLLLFKDFQQAFPSVKLAADLQECKSLFRKSNTQYKKAIQVFVLDGYVTEHIDILFAMSKLYFNLCKLEKSRDKVCSMLDKRRELLQPLLKQLNPKAYPATWQKVLVEVSEIYNDLFQIKCLIATDVPPGKQISEEKLRGSCEIGNKLIGYYRSIIAELENDKEAEKNAQYYRSLINSKFNIAKTLSKMMSNDTKQRVAYLRDSWYKYKEVAEFIKTTAQPQDEFEKELELTNQMIAMLPNKIDRINYGQVSPFE